MKKGLYLIGLLICLLIGGFCYLHYADITKERISYYVVKYTPSVRQYDTDFSKYYSEPTLSVKRVLYDNDSIALAQERITDSLFHVQVSDSLHNAVGAFCNDIHNDSLRRAVNTYYGYCYEERYMLIISYKHVSARDKLIRHIEQCESLDDCLMVAEQLGLCVTIEGI